MNLLTFLCSGDQFCYIYDHISKIAVPGIPDPQMLPVSGNNTASGSCVVIPVLKNEIAV